MIDILSTTFAAIGVVFMLIAALGVLRFPDVYVRMHAASKATSFGLGCLLVAVVLRDPTLAITLKSLLILIVLFLTNPISAHMLGRAAYIHKVPLWRGSKVDELKGKYSADHRTLKS